MSASRPDLTQTTLAVTCIALFAAASLWVLRPFILAFCWATMIVIATWPAMTAIQSRLAGSRTLAALAMTLLLLLVFVLPLVGTVSTLVSHADEIVQWVNSAQSLKIPQAPQWLRDFPVAGDRLAAYWNDFAQTGFAPLKPYAKEAFGWLAGQVGTVGSALVHIMFTVVISAILYAQGDTAAAGFRHFCRRLAGERGDRAAILAAQAVRGVALGVVVTAMAQTLVSGLGLLLADVPFAGPLTLLILAFCVAQLGPALVLVPAVIWMYLQGDTVSATVLLVFSVVAVTMDNVLRPFLIRRGADLPLLLIFAGVIGGLLSVGVVGIFVGPVVLAVTYRLLEEWVKDDWATLPQTPSGSDDKRSD